MLRKVVAAILLSLLVQANASAQEWAVKMFSDTSHDFGTVARGAKAQYKFVVKNLYVEDAHISGVRSSCGCTTPHITRSDLTTFQVGEVVAEFNTTAFLGFKSATLTVTFDKPFPAEVQLNVSGFIRSDVVLQPGALDFGTVDQGTEAERQLMVNYAGRQDWQILDVRSANPNVEVEMTERARGGGKVSYDLLVRLSRNAPVGYLKDQLILVTNDEQASELPVDMEGRVSSPITVSPESLFMGVVKSGDKVTKKLVVRSKKPFKILDVKCDDKSFEVQTNDGAAPVHVIPVVFTAGDELGKIARKIRLTTDQADAAEATFTAYVQVVK